MTSNELLGIERSVSVIKEFDKNSNIEIIVATWSSYRSISIVGVDKFIYSEDVDSFTPPGFKPCNVHRIIKLAKIGLLNAKNELIVRLRSDLEIVNMKDLVMICKQSTSKGHLFNRKVVAIDYSTIDPMRFQIQLPYHVCDWIHIGFKTDLLQIFEVPLPEVNFYSKYINDKRINELGEYIEALRSETYLTAFVIRNSFWKKMVTENKISHFQKISSNIRILKDFKIINIENAGLKSNKHPTNNFDPNRLTPIGYNVWSLQFNSKYPKTLRRFVLKLYYSLYSYYKFHFVLKYFLKSIIYPSK